MKRRFLPVTTIKHQQLVHQAIKTFLIRMLSFLVGLNTVISKVNKQDITGMSFFAHR